MIEEEYAQHHITPLISPELFEQAQKARVVKNRVIHKQTGIANFPKIFQCICGRSHARDDKKGNRYLRCSNHTNHKYPEKCKERYINLKNLEPQLEKLIQPLLPTQEQEVKMIHHIQQEMKVSLSNKGQKTKETLSKIATTKQTINDITMSYATGTISKELFEQAGNVLTQEIEISKVILK